MAYLTEHFSNQSTTSGGNQAGQVDDAVGGLAENSERGNAWIARQLTEEKQKLIEALCQFPVTALWLLNQHQQDCRDDEFDGETALKSDLSNVLADIKRRYESTAQALLDVGLNSPLYVSEKEGLAIATQQFPFSFEDLTRLVDVIVYAYKLRELHYQPLQHDLGCRSEVILKRLEGVKHRQGTKAPALPGLFKALDVDGTDESFLFLMATEMRKLFVELVAAEHRWLMARRELAAANAKLVSFIANQYKGTFLDFDDLVQEGQTGLLKAVDRFDYRLGFQFSTYAGYWIRQAISRALSSSERVVRIPCGQVANINKVYRAKEELATRLGKEPAVRELAEYLGLSEHEVDMLLSISQTALSLEASDDDDDAFSPIDFLEQQIFTHPFNTIAESDLQVLLNLAIETLNPREAKIICSHFGIDADREMTLQEIGSELNLTRERIRQIQVAALNKIRASFGQQLMCFL